MSARTPVIRSTEDPQLDSELLDIRRRLADLEQRLSATTPGSRPPPQPSPQVLPPVFYIGEPVGSGTAGRVLFEDTNVQVADSAKLTFDDATGALVVTAADQSTTKAITAGEATSSTNTSYSSVTARRDCSGVIAAGFGVGYGFNWTSNGGADVQAGAITAERDGAANSAAMLFRNILAGVIQVWAAAFSTGQFALQIAGAGYSLKSGANCKMGTAALSGGTVTVANTSVTANSQIFVFPRGNTNEGWLSRGTIVAGTSFVIQSSNGSDARTFDYIIFEPS